MKKYINLLFAGVVLLSLSNCFDDMDDNITYSSTDVKDFVWKAMNAVYLYKSDIPDLANDRFSSNEEYSDYLATYDFEGNWKIGVSKTQQVSRYRIK